MRVLDGSKSSIISIHALLAESDYLGTRKSCNVYYFYPRSPCGERPATIITICIAPKFLSTLSLRRATARRASRQQPAGISIHALLAESDHPIGILVRIVKISIHALLAESDVLALCSCGGACDFYPRSPCGERRYQQTAYFFGADISIHALLAESDYHTHTYLSILF